MTTLSLIVPTIGRPTLARALLSLRRQAWRAGDEVLLVGDGPQLVARSLWEQFHLPGRYLEVPQTSPPDWGHTPRNLTHSLARGAYLMALDDDDELTSGAVATVRASLAVNPSRPHLFRMSGDLNVGTVWKVKDVRLGNVGTPMFVTPNDSAKLGRYASRHGGDCDFIRETCSFYSDGPVWREEIICAIRPS